MSGERLLEDKKEVRSSNEGVYQEDTGAKGILFEMGCLLKLAILLQVYFVIPSWTIQGLYLCWEVFLHRPISTGLSSLLNYQFFPPTRLKGLK